MGSAGCAKTGSLTERLYPSPPQHHRYLQPKCVSHNDHASTAAPQHYSAAAFTDSRTCFLFSFLPPSLSFISSPCTLQWVDESQQQQFYHLLPWWGIQTTIYLLHKNSVKSREAWYWYSFWPVADADRDKNAHIFNCREHHVLPVVELTYYNFYSYRDGPLGDADIHTHLAK